MKKLLTVLFALMMVFALVGCSKKEQLAKNNYEDFLKAGEDQELEIAMSVQAHQSWWDNKLTIYAQDDDGGYFLYNAEVDEKLAEVLQPGTMIVVTGYKTEWSGEVEFAEGAKVAILAGEKDREGKVYDPKDVTDKLANFEELAKFMNQKVAIKGLEVTNISKKDDASDPDIYISVKAGDAAFDLCLENYLTGPDTDVYKTAESLTVGNTIDIEGFLYWYNGPNPHVTAITVK